MPAFNSPIPRAGYANYHESSPLRDKRDPDATGKLWLKVNALKEQVQQSNNAMSQMNRVMQNLGRRILGMAPQNVVSTIPMFPFKIYQPPNGSNLTLQIRGGLVGFRSNYGKVGFAFYEGNYELPLYAVGTDDIPENGSWGLNGGFLNNDYEMQPAANIGGTVTLDAGGADTLICDNSQTSTHPSGVQIAVPPSISTADISACFWIKIIDDPTLGPYTQLWGKAVGTGGFTASNPPFQQSNTFNQNLYQTFALGVVFYSSGSATPVVTQAQTGHLLNRYLETPTNAPNQTSPPVSGLTPKFYGIPQFNRGYWVASGFSAIAGGVACYPGDVMVDDTPNGSVYPFQISTGVGTAVLCYFSFVYINAVPELETSQPNLPGGNSKWQFYGLVYASSVGPPP